VQSTNIVITFTLTLESVYTENLKQFFINFYDLFYCIMQVATPKIRNWLWNSSCKNV